MKKLLLIVSLVFGLYANAECFKADTSTPLYSSSTNEGIWKPCDVYEAKPVDGKAKVFVFKKIPNSRYNPTTNQIYADKIGPFDVKTNPYRENSEDPRSSYKYYAGTYFIADVPQ